MRRCRAVLLASMLAACGDNVGPDGDILDQLSDLGQVRVTEWFPPEDFGEEEGYRFFDLYFTQPIDHDDPSAGTFEQYAALMVRDPAAPLVFYTSGYGASWKRRLSEPAAILNANQLSLEYRFYDKSRPAAVWSKLTVHQAVEDEHAILTAIDPIFTGTTIQTGGSKGGENTMFHLWLHPEDLDAGIAYVPPVITEWLDPRYATNLHDIGANIPACRDALRAAGREMLVRRTTMETFAAQTADFEIAGVGHATETAIVELEFSFWMTRGETDCPHVPPVTATDEELFTFLNETGAPYAYGDTDLYLYGNQYLYQDHNELGYPVWQHEHLDDLLQFSYEDWSAYLPTEKPVYDPTKPRELAAWLATSPPKLMMIGGEWDPWGPGYPDIPADADTYVYSVPHASHWTASIFALPTAQKNEALAALKNWAGVTATRDRPPQFPMGYTPSRRLIEIRSAENAQSAAP
jgi:hypothetical protein